MARNFTAASSDKARAGTPAITAPPATFACWFRPTANDTGSNRLICVSTEGTPNNVMSLAYSAGGKLEAQQYTGANGLATGTTSPTAGTWYHGAAVFTSNTARAVYLNGVSEATDTTDGGMVIGTTVTTLGYLAFNVDLQFWDGDIAEAAVWAAALDAAEIASLAAGYTPDQVRPASLVAYWPLIGRASPEPSLLDGFGMTLTGTAYADHPRVISPRRRSVQVPSAVTAYTLPAAAGAFALSGKAAVLKYGRRLAAGAGVFALSGKAVGLRRGYRLVCAAGAFALSGQAVGLKRGYRLAAGAGAFTLSGKAVGLRRTRRMSAGVGAFTLAGQAVALRRGRTITAGAGAFALSGKAVTFRRTYRLSAGAGTFVLAGQAVTLAQSGVLVMPATAGTFVLSGKAVGLRRTYRLTAGAGAFALAGKAVTLRRGKSLTAGVGTFALTGKAVVFARTRGLRAGAGTFLLTGRAVGLTAPSRGGSSGVSSAFLAAMALPRQRVVARILVTARMPVVRARGRVRRPRPVRGTAALRGRRGSVLSTSRQRIRGPGRLRGRRPQLASRGRIDNGIADVKRAEQIAVLTAWLRD